MEEQIHAPTPGELPTAKQLNRATLIAAGIASALLVTTVLPAEYGYDPTGIGRLLGLTAMGEMKREQALADSVEEAPTEDIVMDTASTPAAPAARTDPAPGARQGDVTLTLAPNQGTEVKATMKAGAELRYEWSTGGPQVNFELHGEEAGAASSDFTSYEKGASAGESGTFRAPFDGTHGWFWRNRTGAPITIRVQATGNFEKFERVGS